PDPEHRIRSHAEADAAPGVHHPRPAERGQHRLVEGGAGGEVGTLDGEVVEHRPIVPPVVPARSGQIARRPTPDADAPMASPNLGWRHDRRGPIPPWDRPTETESTMDREHALVLGGGGIAGIAWHTGMVVGMADAGVDVTGADLIVGTSAGSTVAAQLASGTTVEEWFQRQVDPARQGHELRPTGMSVADLWEMMIRVHEETPDPTERRRRIAAMALAADTVPETVRRQVVAGRLPGVTWPDRRVVIVAVDAQRGDRCEFD